MGSIRVLIVDDSPTMCRILSNVLGAAEGLEVVGTALHAGAAKEAIKTLAPDVITLDVEMPGTDGLSFLRQIMKHRPTPVVMVSSHTERGADATVEAMSAGAIACVAKPTCGALSSQFADLPRIVREAAAARVARRAPGEVRAEPLQSAVSFGQDRVIALGSSTGGVEALIRVLSGFPALCPPTVITQHMPAGFTGSLARRLNTLCAPHVAEAVDGAPLEPGHVYLAPGGSRHLEIRGRTKMVCQLREAAPVNGHCPSVDMLFTSVASVAASRTVAVLLTGMGRDGARGMLAVRNAGGRTLAQDEATSVVWGMPRAAHEMGAAECLVPLEGISRQIAAFSSDEHRYRSAS